MQRLIVSQKIKSILRHIWLTKYLRFPTQPQQLAFSAVTTVFKLYTVHFAYDGHGYNGELVIADKNSSPKPIKFKTFLPGFNTHTLATYDNFRAFSEYSQWTE